MSESKSEIEKIINKYLLQWGLVIVAINGGEEIENGGLAKTLTDKFHIIPKSDSPEKWVEKERTWKGNKLYIELKWRGEK